MNVGDLLTARLEKELGSKRASALSESKQLTLGGLINKLRTVLDKRKRVHFEFGNLHPTSLASWRGIYAELALGYAEEGSVPTVSDLLCECQAAIGQTYQGYKGGDFVMCEDTPIWIANYGNSGSTGLVDVVESEGGIVLRTAYCECY